VNWLIDMAGQCARCGPAKTRCVRAQIARRLRRGFGATDRAGCMQYAPRGLPRGCATSLRPSKWSSSTLPDRRRRSRFGPPGGWRRPFFSRQRAATPRVCDCRTLEWRAHALRKMARSACPCRVAIPSTRSRCVRTASVPRTWRTAGSYPSDSRWPTTGPCRISPSVRSAWCVRSTCRESKSRSVRVTIRPSTGPMPCSPLVLRPHGWPGDWRRPGRRG
jgi:hypothetical protein